MDKKKPIAEVDFDDGEYIGDGQDGVYVQAAEGPDGWYVSTVVDSDTGGFVDSLCKDDGPYPTEKEALRAGRHSAMDWCMENRVSVDIPDFFQEES